MEVLDPTLSDLEDNSEDVDEEQFLNDFNRLNGSQMRQRRPRTYHELNL
jgi:hypothetical protein